MLTLNRDLREATIIFTFVINSGFQNSCQHWDTAYINLASASGLCGGHAAGLRSSLAIFAEFVFIPRINTCNILIKSSV